jgi:large subunit ribosomal protein L28e
MTTPSPSLLWELTKKHNAFLVKNNGITLSCEPGNISNIHSSKYSGLAQQKAVGYETNPRTGKVKLIVKRSGMGNKPKQSRQVLHFPVNNPTKASKIVTKNIQDTYYRRDLKDQLLLRAAKMTRAHNRQQMIENGTLKVVFGRGKAAKREAGGIKFDEKKGGANTGAAGDVEMKLNKNEQMPSLDADDGPPGLDGGGAAGDEGPPGLD